MLCAGTDANRQSGGVTSGNSGNTGGLGGGSGHTGTGHSTGTGNSGQGQGLGSGGQGQGFGNSGQGQGQGQGQGHGIAGAIPGTQANKVLPSRASFVPVCTGGMAASYTACMSTLSEIKTCCQGFNLETLLRGFRH